MNCFCKTHHIRSRILRILNPFQKQEAQSRKFQLKLQNTHMHIHIYIYIGTETWSTTGKTIIASACIHVYKYMFRGTILCVLWRSSCFICIIYRYIYIYMCRNIFIHLYIYTRREAEEVETPPSLARYTRIGSTWSAMIHTYIYIYIHARMYVYIYVCVFISVCSTYIYVHMKI